MTATERLALEEADRLRAGLHARQWRAVCWLLAGLMWAVGCTALLVAVTVA